ncbi:restriction endonuclease subunit S [Limosilactobacillus fermentum]|uniref:restriction endonuclease subunit S n=1 Tax=Limosilactobacillus fermentum TaxID=1613 RepID=UPI0033501AB6
MNAKQAKYPQLRFKGFTDPWVQSKLGEVGKTQSGIGFPDAEQGGTEGVPFYKVSDMNKPGNEHEMVNANNYVNYEQLSRKKWKIIETVPAVIFAKVGAAIMLNRKRLVTSPFLIDNNTMAYVFDGSWNIDFGKTLFETINLPRYAQVGALPSYNGSDIESIEVTLLLS